MIDPAPASRHIIFVGGTSEPGGLHVHTADIAQACAALGLRVTIVCPSINYFDGLLHDDRVVVRCIAPPEDGSRWHQRIRWWRRIASGGPRPDIVICRGSLAETDVIDLVGAALSARRLFTIEHRPWEKDWPWRLSKAQYGALSNLLQRRAIGVSDEIEASAVDEFGFSPRKVRTCLNWVHPEFRAPGDQERRDARARLALDPSTVLIGYAGRLAPEKRLDVLLQAFAGLASAPGVRLELGLLGDGWKRKALAQLAADLGIADRVRFLGWSTTPSAIFRACDIFVLPSLVEGFPLALMEAMASACACVAHPMSSTERLIEDGRTGVLVDMTTPEGLATGITGLIARGEGERRRIGVAAAARIAAEFSRERRLPDMLAALDIEVSLLPAPGPRLLAFGRS